MQSLCNLLWSCFYGFISSSSSSVVYILTEKEIWTMSKTVAVLMCFDKSEHLMMMSRRNEGMFASVETFPAIPP